jgi:hypothetical protein
VSGDPVTVTLTVQLTLRSNTAPQCSAFQAREYGGWELEIMPISQETRRHCKSSPASPGKPSA